MNVAIVGAGIAGLTAFATLNKMGINALIYEQAKEFSRVGAAIQLTPNAVRVTRGLDLEEELCAQSFMPEVGYNREWDTGKIPFFISWAKKQRNVMAHRIFLCIAQYYTTRSLL